MLTDTPDWPGQEADGLLPALLAPILPSALVMSGVGPELADELTRMWRALREKAANNFYGDHAEEIDRLVHDCASELGYKIWSASTPNLNELRNAHPTWITRTSGVDAGSRTSSRGSRETPRRATNKS